MLSRVLAIWSLLFLKASSALDSSYFKFEEPHYPFSLYHEIMDIFMKSSDTATPQVIGLVSDNFDEFSAPVKRLHENWKAVVMGQNEPILVHSSIVEINCEQSKSGGILTDEILPRIYSYTVIIILKDSREHDFNEIKSCMLEVFDKFWQRSTVNVVIMFSSNYKKSMEENSSTALETVAYVYEPYNEEPLRKVIELSYRNIFYDKTANLHLHPLRILAYRRQRFFFEEEDGITHLAGIDGSLTETLGKIFNATILLNYQIGFNVGLWNKGSNQHTEELRNGTVDIWMNARIVYAEVHQGIEYSYPRERMDIICILPKNNDGGIKYKSIIGGRVLKLLITFIGVYPVVSLLVFLVNKILRQHMPLLILAKVVLNQSDEVMQKSYSTTMRILLGSWLVGSLVYSTSLQTVITARIIRPSVENRMTTIKEVIESGFDLRIEQTYWAITKNHYDDRLFSAIKNNIDIVTDDYLFDVQAPEVGYLATQDAMEFVEKQTRTYVLRESFLPNLVAYCFPEKSPFIPRFNKALAAVTEAGITQKWVADNHRRLKIDSKIGTSITPARYITYTHLQSVIYVYSAGMLIAFVVFICEIKFHRYIESIGR